jgi:hypothetical protein
VPGVLIASLLVCGLFGTLFSLRLTLQDPAFLSFFEKEGSTTTSSFHNALMPIVKGFGEAFKASIWGVGGTIFLIFMRVFVRARREVCFEKLESYAVKDLLPYFIEPEKTALERATKILESGTEKFGKVAQLMDGSIQLIDQAITNLQQTTEQANQVFGEKGPVVCRLSEFAELANVFNGNSETIAKTIKQASSSLDQTVASNSDLLDRISSWSAEQSKRQDELTGSFKGLVDTVTTSGETTKAAFLTSISELSRSQGEVVKVLDLSLQKQIANADTLTQTIGSSYGGSLAALNKENKKLIQMLSEHNEEQSSKHKLIQEDLLATLRVTSQQIAKVVLKEDRVDIDAFNEFRKHLEALNLKLDGVLDANKEAIESSFKRHDKLDAKMSSSFKEFSDRVKTLSKVIDKISDAHSPEHQNLFMKLFGRSNGKASSGSEK